MLVLAFEKRVFWPAYYWTVALADAGRVLVGMLLTPAALKPARD
jgi:hypothetical protein